MASSSAARASDFTLTIPIRRIAKSIGHARTSSFCLRPAAPGASSTTRRSWPRALTPEVTCDILGPYLRKAAKSNPYDAEAEVEDSRASMPKTLFRRIPVHPYILTFQLELHLHVWVHVADMALYVYRPELKQKLVLPGEQTDLIDIFTAEMDVLMVDIVAGKSGGRRGLVRGTAGSRQDIARRRLCRNHSPAALPHAFRPARPRRRRDGKRAQGRAHARPALGRRHVDRGSRRLHQASR